MERYITVRLLLLIASVASFGHAPISGRPAAANPDAFTAPKKKANPSAKKCKQECGERLSEALQESPVLISRIASVQQTWMDELDSLVRRDAEGTLSAADREQLQAINQDLMQIRQEMERFERRLADHERKIKALKRK